MGLTILFIRYFNVVPYVAIYMLKRRVRRCEAFLGAFVAIVGDDSRSGVIGR